MKPPSNRKPRTPEQKEQRKARDRENMLDPEKLLRRRASHKKYADSLSESERQARLQYVRDWRARQKLDPERVKLKNERCRFYRATNPNIKAGDRARYERNKGSDEYKAACRRRSAKHRAKPEVILKSRERRELAWYRYSNLKRRHKEIGKPGQVISKEEYSVMTESARCVYCSGPTCPQGGRLDRVDNSRGYTVGNVVVACGQCNVARGKLPLGVWLATWDALVLMFPELAASMDPWAEECMIGVRIRKGRFSEDPK